MESDSKFFYEEFDPGSGLTLAACIIHASRAALTLFFSGRFLYELEEDKVRAAADG